MKTPFGSVLVLLLYLLPGFLAMQLYQARYPAKPMSRFEAAGWSILHSFIILLGLASAAHIFGCASLDVLSHDTNSKIQPKTIIVLLGGGFIWGRILITYHWIRIRVPFLPAPDSQAIWPVVVDNVPKEKLWVLVHTKQGTLYLGWIKEYSFDPAAENHDFLLRPAYLVDKNLHVQRDLTQGGVYLNTRDIESLEMIPGKPKN